MADPETCLPTPAKRSREDDENAEPEMPPADMNDSSEEEIGPMPVPGGDGAEVKIINGRRKKRAVLPHERIYLNHLPDTDRYHKSFMHRDIVNFVAVTR